MENVFEVSSSRKLGEERGLLSRRRGSSVCSEFGGGVVRPGVDGVPAMSLGEVAAGKLGARDCLVRLLPYVFLG